MVITGLSGSGKSSLAFDTLYAEGQRRYVESLSAYARQFLQLMEKPDVDLIEGLSPAIAIEQRATGLRAAVPAADGKARRRPDRRPVARDRHRAARHLTQPALHRRHGDRDSRLPAAALCAGRHALLPRPQGAVAVAERLADGGCRAGPARRHEDRRAGAGRARAQGRVRRVLRRHADPGFRTLPHRRGHRRGRRPAAAGEEREALARRRGRPAEGARRRPAAAGRVLRDRVAAGRRPRAAARPRQRAGDRLFQPLRLPGVQLFAGRAGAAAVLLQQSDGRLRGLRRPRCRRVFRRAARRRPSGTRAGQWRHQGLGRAQPVLPPDAGDGGAALRLRPRPAVRSTAGFRAAGDPARFGQRGNPIYLHQRARPQDGAAASVRGRDPQPGATPEGDRLAGGARRTGQAAQPARLPGVRGLAAAARGAQRVRWRRRPAAGHRQDRQGDRLAAALPGRCRPRLSVARPLGRHAVGRRVAAHPPGVADRLRAHRRHVRAGRALNRPAPARQRPPDRHPEAPARSRQQRDRGRARRRRYPRGRLHR